MRITSVQYEYESGNLEENAEREYRRGGVRAEHLRERADGGLDHRAHEVLVRRVQHVHQLPHAPDVRVDCERDRRRRSRRRVRALSSTTTTTRVAAAAAAATGDDGGTAERTRAPRGRVVLGVGAVAAIGSPRVREEANLVSVDIPAAKFLVAQYIYRTVQYLQCSMRVTELQLEIAANRRFQIVSELRIRLL